MGRQRGADVLRLGVLLLVVVLSSAFLPSETLIHVADPATAGAAQAAHPRLCSALTRLALVSADGPAALASFAAQAGVPMVEGLVQVMITAHAGAIAEAQRAVESLNGHVTHSVASQGWLQGWIPADALLALAERPAVAYVRVPERAWLEEEAMPAPTQAHADGLSLMGASLWHISGHQGQGVKVGIIDQGFGGHRTLLGDALPSQVVARTFVDGEGDGHLNAGTTHGTAVAEIVHRIAPQAELYLAKIETLPELYAAVAWLMDEGVHVIHTSPRWYALAPGDGTGPLAELAQAAQAQGIVWVAPAGDARIVHWSGEYVDEHGDGWLDWRTGERVNWLIVDGQYNLPSDIVIDIWMRWSDWDAVDQDLNVCLVHMSQFFLVHQACSKDPQTGLAGQTPTEHLRATTSGHARPYGIMVYRAHGDRPVHIDIFVAGVSTLQHKAHGQSLADIADVPSVLSVSALAAGMPLAQAVYSSEGPTKGPGGVAEGGLAKPDLAAYTGTITASRGALEGTAAAAAHVTGAVALVRGAHPDWDPDQVHGLLHARALDLGAPGWDPIYGHGRLHLGPSPTASPARYWIPLAGR